MSDLPLPLPPVPLPPVLLVGAGGMGLAMFEGWQRQGLLASVLVRPSALSVPAPHRWIAGLDRLDGFVPGVVVLAVKPQKAADILPAVAPIVRRGNALVVSVMAGIPHAALCAALGGAACVRAMPNTPAAIGRGVSLAWAPSDGAGAVDPAGRALATRLLGACGDVEWLPSEARMDVATALSGCGPAYVFLLAELLEASGVAHGLSPSLARALARRTLSGAGALLDARPDADAADLRRAVTSPNGVTERALQVLMAPSAWPASLDLAIGAAAARSAELAQTLGGALRPAPDTDRT